jgi:ribosomal protein L24
MAKKVNVGGRIQVSSSIRRSKKGKVSHVKPHTRGISVNKINVVSSDVFAKLVKPKPRVLEVEKAKIKKELDRVSGIVKNWKPIRKKNT